MPMASILQIVFLQIIISKSLCNGQQCTGMSCPDGLSLVPINNLSDSERWTFDSNDTVQVVCYNETGEPHGCLPDYDDLELFQILLAVVCSLSIVGDGFVILSLCMFRTIRTSFHVVLINVCLANCGFDLTVVTLGSLESLEYTKEACYSVAVLIHFFLLSQFMLMSATMLDTVYCFYNACKLKKQSLNCQYGRVPALLVFGWGVPLLIVTASLIVDNTSEWVGYGQNYTCWIDHLISEVIFVDIPFLISMLFNMIMFTILVALVIRSHACFSLQQKTFKQANKRTIHTFRHYYLLCQWYNVDMCHFQVHLH